MTLSRSPDHGDTAAPSGRFFYVMAWVCFALRLIIQTFDIVRSSFGWGPQTDVTVLGCFFLLLAIYKSMAVGSASVDRGSA